MHPCKLDCCHMKNLNKTVIFFFCMCSLLPKAAFVDFILTENAGGNRLINKINDAFQAINSSNFS